MSEPTNTPKPDAVDKTAEVPKKKPNQLTAFCHRGPERDRIFVHVALMKADSDYFRAALEGEWIEARTGEIHLADVHPYFFASFVYWVYRQTVPFLTGEEVDFEDADFEDANLFIANKLHEIEEKDSDSDALGERSYWELCSTDHDYLRLITAYILGDRLQSRRFKNTIIDRIIAHLQTVGKNIPTCLPLRYAFENTTPKSQLRKLLVHVAYWRGSKRFLGSQFNVRQNPELMAQLGTLMFQWGMYIRQDSLSTRDLSEAYFHEKDKATICKYYHEHEEGEPRCT